MAAGAQGAESKLVASVKDNGEAAEGGSPGYMGVLVKNLTPDAWVVIVILGIMFLIAFWVMVAKTLFVVRADKTTGASWCASEARLDMLALEQGPAHPHSSLFRLYKAGVRELKKRDIGTRDEQTEVKPLSGASLDAVKASVDADMVRESHSLNALMVFLTIAISGGPFLGLLGTVVGVMITFAAIAGGRRRQCQRDRPRHRRRAPRAPSPASPSRSPRSLATTGSPRGSRTSRRTCRSSSTSSSPVSPKSTVRHE